MPVTLSKLTANRAHARIDCGDGDVLEVDYYPARLTGEMLQRFVAVDRLAELSATEGLEVLASATEMLLALLAGWDLRDDDGHVLPVDHDVLQLLGLMWQWRILNGIMASTGAGSPGEATAPEPRKARSGAGSSRKAS